MVRTVKSKEKILRGNLYLGTFFALLLFSFLAAAGNFGSNNNANLNISDEVELQSTHYTKCLGPDSNYCSRKSKSSYDLYDVIFYANFTENSTSNPINSSYNSGDCQIRFNETGIYSSWNNMNYNQTNLRFEYNRTFNYKGILYYQINCTSNLGNVTLIDNFTLLNTPPEIYSAGGFVDFDIDEIQDDILSCNEDSLCVYNFSRNVSEDDLNDVLVFSYVQNSNTTLTNFTLNSSLGMMIVNITHNSESGNDKRVQLTVSDGSSSDTATLKVNVNPVNDAPYFTNLNNSIIRNWSIGNFDHIIYAEDEENDKPYSFNITFLNCSVAEWSTRNCSDFTEMQLFNSSEAIFNGASGFINLSFALSRNDVGNYTVNFTVNDLNNSIQPYNASFSKIVSFQILNVNSPPNITYACNDRNTTENSGFECYINVSDIDEFSNITLTSNVLNSPGNNFFKFNGTLDSAVLPLNISTGYNASFYVNFTTDDLDVGNWTVELQALDNDDSITTLDISFNVSNVLDNVYLNMKNLSSNPLFTSAIYNYSINASDDDLLIIQNQKRVFNESLTFSSNVSWFAFNYSSPASGNYTTGHYTVYPSIVGPGQHYVNISVSDLNNHSSDSFILFVNVTNNTAPSWNTLFSSNTTYYITEYNSSNNASFYLNLGANVTDVDGDAITFSYVVNNISNSFNSFEYRFNLTSGVINLSANDSDVGYHNITILAIDSKNAQTPLNFIFVVNNVNDLPSISYLYCGGGCSVEDYITDNMTTTEDNVVQLDLRIFDDDLRIDSSQKQSFYDENFTINLTFTGGPNNRLFSYTYNSPENSDGFRDYDMDFTPNKTDVGLYVVGINVTDRSNRSTYMQFNLTILENQHPPEMDFIADYNLSIYDNFFLDINSSDAEEGEESAGDAVNFSYVLTNLTFNGDSFLSINNVSGIISNSSTLRGGIWNFSVNVTDSYGLNDSQSFVLYIFDHPNLTFPGADLEFNMVENISFDFNVSSNHSVTSDLTYDIYINDLLRDSVTGFGNAEYFIIDIMTNFSDETTCTGISNLTINVSNEKLSSIYTWNLTVNHTNYPLEFYDTIGTGNPKTLTSRVAYFSEYFRDLDANDGCNNQTIGFIALNLSTNLLTNSIVNWSNGTSPNITFTGDGNTNYSIIAFEYNGSTHAQNIRNVSSNNFTVSVDTDVEVVNQPSSGGGGGSSSTSAEFKPISLRIIVPDPVSSGTKERIVLPLSLKNDGQLNLKEIYLGSDVSINGSISNDVVTNLSFYYLSALNINQTVNLTLIAEIDTEIEGLYEINIYANVTEPDYSDWGKIYLTVKEGTSFEEKIIFTEELIVSNPECAEIQEIVDDAREDYQNGNMQEAERKINLAISSCKDAISQKPSPIIKNVLRSWGISNYVLFAAVVASALGFLYYFYKRYMLSRAINLEDDD